MCLPLQGETNYSFKCIHRYVYLIMMLCLRHQPHVALHKYSSHDDEPPTFLSASREVTVRTASSNYPIFSLQARLKHPLVLGPDGEQSASTHTQIMRQKGRIGLFTPPPPPPPPTGVALHCTTFPTDNNKPHIATCRCNNKHDSNRT